MSKQSNSILTFYKFVYVLFLNIPESEVLQDKIESNYPIVIGFYNILRKNIERIMQSRTRKYRKSFDNYEQAIQKQLNDDFQVYEYLNQNKLQGNNIDEYLKLYDAMQVTKNQKKKKFQSLQVNYVQMSSDTFENHIQTSQVEDWGGARTQFLIKYEESQIKTMNQIEVKNNLWRQIVETKKSLNLLKGDIGHLVGRNQSAKLIQSKISKVKIVADDQLKRVSLAFVKDKDQLKQRGEMQRKFNKKLKNVSMFEDTTLNRLKKSYLDTMVKKKNIHDRLNYIERVSASINQSGQKQKLKNEINNNTLELYRNFIMIKNLVQKVPLIQDKFGHNSQQIHQFVSWLRDQENYNEGIDFGLMNKSQIKQSDLIPENIHINSSDLQMITQQKLIGFQRLFKKEHFRIMEEIEKKTSQYDLQMKKSQEITLKLEQCNEKIQKIQINFSKEFGIKYLVTKETRQEYSHQLKKFICFLKTIFALLQYIEKNLNYSSLTVQLKKKRSEESQKSFIHQQNTSKTKKISQNFSLKVPLDSKPVICSDKSLSLTNKSYISELYRTYFILLKEQQDDQKLESIQETIFQELQQDVQNWLFLIKQYFLSGQQSRYSLVHKRQQREPKALKLQKQSSKIRESRLSQLKTQKIGVQTQQQEQNQVRLEQKFNFQNYKRHHTVYREENISRYHSYSSSSVSNQSRYGKTAVSSVNRQSANAHSFSTSKIINLQKLKNATEHKKAQRIKLLENVDKDYYKMLKSTLKMEKENTRKNYQFLRTFKRTKYSSKDEILQEKRFECSFSMLFAGNKDEKTTQKPQLKSKKSCFFKNQNFQKRISRLNQSRNILSSSKIIKSSGSTIDLNEKGIKQLKENVRKVIDKENLKTRIPSKHNLSIKMKDIINLV